MTLNVWSRAHYHIQNDEKQEWQRQIILTLRSLHIPKPLRCPVVVKAKSYTVRERDHDGCIIPIKYALDALVQGGWLEDDGPKFVDAVMIGWAKAEDSKSEQVEFSIYEAGEKIL